MLQYLLAAIIFVILDGFYLNFFKNFYNKQIKSIQGSDVQINIIATGIGATSICALMRSIVLHKWINYEDFRSFPNHVQFVW